VRLQRSLSHRFGALASFEQKAALWLSVDARPATPDGLFAGSRGLDISSDSSSIESEANAPREGTMGKQLEFVVNGNPVALTRAGVLRAMRGVDAEPVQKHSVLINGTRYPVKQVLQRATGLDRLDFTSATARRILAKLGFEVARS
jgi:hypothetical protein